MELIFEGTFELKLIRVMLYIMSHIVFYRVLFLLNVLPWINRIIRKWINVSPRRRDRADNLVGSHERVQLSGDRN